MAFIWPSFSSILEHVDASWLMQNTQRLWKVEFGACFRHYGQAATLVEDLMRESDLDGVERIAVPADGKTIFLDRQMPLAWDATRGTLTVRQSPVAFPDPIVASYERHPFHLIKGSVSTPAEGELTKLINEQQLFGGEDPQGAMVILEPDTYPRDTIIRAICDLGARGFVADNLVGRYDTPDGISWFNACTEGSHWHVQAEDRPFIGFSVTPRTGDRLRSAVRQGPVVVHVLSDGRRYPGEFHTVTGLIPGEEAQEVWLLAHLYEPMPDDNSAGVIAALEVARVLRRLISSGQMPRPRFTLRVVFSMEMYGFAAYAAQRGVPLRDRVLGAMNLDAVPNKPSATLYLAPPDAAFFGDYLLEQLFEEYQVQGQLPHITLCDQGMYGDDLFLNDPMTGLPTAWLMGRFDWWHNSEQKMNVLLPELLARHTAFYATALTRMLSLRQAQQEVVLAYALSCARKHIHSEAAGIWERFSQNEGDERQRVQQHTTSWMQWRLEREEARLRDFARVWPSLDLEAELMELRHHQEQTVVDLSQRLASISSSSTVQLPQKVDPIRDIWAASSIPQRAAPWQPHDQANVPQDARTELPDRVIYGPFSTLLAHTDGQKNLKELIEYTEWVHNTRISASQIKQYISAIERLAAYGHLGVMHTQVITRPHIVQALHEVGLSAGDLVFVHSALSSFGYIEGGAETVIDAFLEVLGPRGTLLMPTFTNSVIYCNGEWVVSRDYRPFNIDSSAVWVGQIPAAFCRLNGVRRSSHPTHSVAGWGPLAEDCLAEHQETDAPTGRQSPFGKLVAYKGKMVWFGADSAATTFFHFLEDEANLFYLQPALCRVQRKNGNIESVLIPQWLPGHRDFYHIPGEESKMYRSLLAAGLTIRQAELGIGRIKLIEAVAMYELGLAALEADPWLMLCDNPECLFCRTAKTQH